MSSAHLCGVCRKPVEGRDWMELDDGTIVHRSDCKPRTPVRKSARKRGQKGATTMAAKKTSKKAAAKNGDKGKKIALTAQQLNDIVRVLKETGSRSETLRRMPSLTPVIVGKVASSTGLSKSDAAIVKRDAEAVVRWLVAGGMGDAAAAKALGTLRSANAKRKARKAA